MNAYDHYDFRNDMRALDEKRQAERAAAAERRAEQSARDNPRSTRNWQARFLIRFTIKAASWGLLIWFLLGQPEIPIRWLQ